MSKSVERSKPSPFRQGARCFWPVLHKPHNVFIDMCTFCGTTVPICQLHAADKSCSKVAQVLALVVVLDMFQYKLNTVDSNTSSTPAIMVNRSIGTEPSLSRVLTTRLL